MTDVFWKANDRERGEFFRRMSDAEAESFFDEYLRFRDERIEALNRQFYETGGGNECDLDFEPDSLLEVWQWAKTQIKAREHGPADLERIMKLPDQLRYDYLARKALSEESLKLVNDIAYYLAGVAIRNLKGVHWQVCRTKVNRYIDENQPVLGGFRAPQSKDGVNPRNLVRVAAIKALAGESSDDALVAAFERCYNDLEERPKR